MEFVSRDSLVEEITGIKRTDIGWDAARQEIYQFDKVIRGMSSYNDTQKISVEFKDSFVKLMKSIYNSEELRIVVKKFGRKEYLSDEEALLLYDTLVDCSNDEKLREFCKQNRDELKVDAVIDKCNEVCKEIKDFLAYMSNMPSNFTINTLECLKKDIQEIIKYYKVDLDIYKSIINSTYDNIDRLVDESADNYKRMNNYPLKKKKL